MDHSLKFEQTPNHHLCLKDRKVLELSGVNKIDSFDSYEFLIETSLGYIHITGTDLSLVRLDQELNEVTIRGTIDSMSYVNEKKVHPKENMFTKLMK